VLSIHPITVIYALLIVELILLAISFALLFLSFREHRGRSELMDALFKATRELTRYEYFLAVIDSIRSSKRSINGIITGRRPTTDLGREAVKDITKALSEASKRGVKIRYVVYKSPDRLYVAHLYKKAGAEIRMNSMVALNDLRYMVVDESVCVLGLAGKERSAPTRMGYVIKSSTLAHILLADFEKIWNDSETLEDYTKKIVKEIIEKSPSLDEGSIATRLGIPRDVVVSILKEIGAKV
jgi:hypothetical protein